MHLDFRHSLITGASCWLAATLAFALHCESPWWAVISAWVVSGPDLHASAFRAGLRVLGTLAGYVIGYQCARFAEGDPFALALAMFFVGAVGTYQRFRSRYSYAWVIGCITAFILIVLAITDPSSVYRTAHYRLYEIVSGVIAATLCQRLLAPLLGFDGPSIPGAPHAASTPEPAPVVRRELLTAAVIGGLLPVMIMVLWSQFNLPSPVQIVVTALATIDQDVVSAQFKAAQRLLGCLSGGVLGCLTVLLSSSSFAIWSLFFVGGIVILSRLHLGKGRWSYVGTQGGIAYIVTLVTGNHPPDSILPVVNRIAGMVSGVLLLSAICGWVRLWGKCHK